jgi:hypothetical protein
VGQKVNPIGLRLGVNKTWQSRWYADPREYAGQWTRDIREIAARTKDFFMVLFDADPVVLGESIPISGDGNLTNG